MLSAVSSNRQAVDLRGTDYVVLVVWSLIGCTRRGVVDEDEQSHARGLLVLKWRAECDLGPAGECAHRVVADQVKRVRQGCDGGKLFVSSTRSR